MASGAVIENLSTRKLLLLLATLSVTLAVFVFIGAEYTPNPSTSMEFLMTKCYDKQAGTSKEWFYVRPMKCQNIPALQEHHSTSEDVRDIVFVAQMPHARNGVNLQYSPWFQYLLGLMEVDVVYDPTSSVRKSAYLQLEVRMGYRDEGDADNEWKTLVETTIDRKLECDIDEDKKIRGHTYNCSTIDLFELGSNSHAYYILNIRIPVNQTACARGEGPNCNIGMINDLRVIGIHQNGGFTLVWLLIKTFVWPIVVAATYWYYNRLQQLHRVPSLNEQAILALGIGLSVFDCPVEWITLYTQAPFMLLLTDIRQGLFYTVLLSFWLIFVGEHLIDDSERNSINNYYKNLSFVFIASGALLCYDLFERGMQLKDPFHSVWSSESGSNWAYFTIYVAGFSAFVYFVFLVYKIGRAWKAIQNKRAQLYRLKELNRLKVQGVIYRFKFLFLFTLACAALTFIGYVMKQYGEGQLHGDDYETSWMTKSTSAFFTGTFGIWNVYVLFLLAMYAPSHKIYKTSQALTDEQDELIDSQVDSTPLTTFLKPSTD